MVEIGDKITFTPTAWSEAGRRAGHYIPAWMQTDKVQGTVVYINEAHRYYRVEYCVVSHWGRKWIDHECFLFPPPPAPADEPLTPTGKQPLKFKYLRPLKDVDKNILEGKLENENSSNLQPQGRRCKNDNGD